MRRKFFKKIISILCAGAMSFSVPSSVFSIKTNSCNEEIKKAVFECNDRINTIKPQISIYLEKLTDQMNRLSDEKNCEYFGEESEKISQVAVKLSKIQQLLKKTDNINLNSPSKFNIFDFNQELMDLEAYMAHEANRKNIDIDEIIEIIKRIDVDYWNACIQNQSEENKIFDEFNEFYKNTSLSKEINSGSTLEEKVEICLKDLEKNPNDLKNNSSHINLLKEYAGKYISEYEIKNLKFIEKNFNSPDKWSFAFDKYLGSEKFFEQVIGSFGEALNEIFYKNIKGPNLSTISNLDCFLERIIVTTFKGTTDQTSQLFCDEYELSRYLSYILELNNIINCIKEKTIMTEKYDEFNLNCSAVKLKDLERVFENIFKDLTGTNWIATLSMTNKEIDNSKKNKKILINSQKKAISNRDIAIIDLIHSTCSPINKIMTIAVNNKLNSKELDLDEEERHKINDSFENLKNNIEYLCKNLYIIEPDSGRLKVIYCDGEHKFENNALAKLNLKNSPELPTIVILENLNNPIHGQISNSPLFPNNIAFLEPPMSLQNPFSSPHASSHAPANSPIDIPLVIDVPIANNVNDINNVVDNAVQNALQNALQNAFQNAVQNSTLNNIQIVNFNQ